MRYRKLPNTDLEVSEICLGTMTFGDRIGAAEAAESVAVAVDHGVNFLDTADIYPPGSSGESERLLGEAVRPYRDRVLLATKVAGAFDADPANRGLSRRHILDAVEGSLRRLQTDHIDLYYAHFPDPSVSRLELMEAMNELIRAGKIRYYGVSNHPSWMLCEMVLTARERGLEPPVVTQSGYNLLTRGIENELLPFCRDYDMGVVAFNPLAGGMLTGKYQTGLSPEGSRFSLQKGYHDRYYSDRNREAVAQLQEIASELGIGLIELSYRWLLTRPGVHSLLMGFSGRAQLEDNLRFAAMEKDIPLPEDRLDAIWKNLTGNRFNYHY